MKEKIKRSIIALMLILAITVDTVVVNPEVVFAAKTYSLYVSGVSISKSGSTIKVSYTAGKVPNGATCWIGYEDWTGTIRKQQLIGNKGKHTVTWKVSSSVFRIYTKLVTRNYTDKNIIKTYHNVTSGTTSYKITQKDVNNANFQASAGTVIISLASIGLGFWKVSAGVGASLGGMAYGVIDRYKYAPSKGDIVKTTRTYNNSTENLTITVKIYRNGTLIKKSSVTKHIGF